MHADAAILQLLPHRPPMLLLQTLDSVSATHARASALIEQSSAFFVPDHGIPAWVGLEYMGQTAALIAGFQEQAGAIEPHLGLLLGTRQFTCTQAWFPEGTTLLISCSEIAVVGHSLATFYCEIADKANSAVYATAKLSVFRKPLSAIKD